MELFGGGRAGKAPRGFWDFGENAPLVMVQSKRIKLTEPIPDTKFTDQANNSRN